MSDTAIQALDQLEDLNARINHARHPMVNVHLDDMIAAVRAATMFLRLGNVDRAHRIAQRVAEDLPAVEACRFANA